MKLSRLFILCLIPWSSTDAMKSLKTESMTVQYFMQYLYKFTSRILHCMNNPYNFQIFTFLNLTFYMPTEIAGNKLSLVYEQEGGLSEF